MTPRAAIVQVSLWNSPYLGNFMSSQLLLAHAVRERFGLATHHVLAPGAEEQPWLSELDGAQITWSVLPRERSSWRTHLGAAVREHAAALVHTHFTAADLPAARAARSAGVPCVWHIHTGFNGYPLRQRAKDLFKMRIVARHRVERIVAVSPWLGDFVRRRGAPGSRIVVVSNPIVVERFAALPDRSEARARLGLSASATVVLGLGWWPEVKGVDLLVEAMGALAERRPDCELLLVGEERMRSFLSKLLDLPPAWLRVSGFVDDIAWLFAAADVFVSASRHEGQPSAIGEALACGLPVVMSDIPGVQRWAEAPHVSMFASEDVQGLVRNLERVLEQPADERATAGAENRRWIERNAGVQRWCDELCAIYAPLLGGEPRSGSPGDDARESSPASAARAAANEQATHQRRVP